MFFMQCMGLKPVVEEILPFLWYMAILAAAVLPCRSFQTSSQSLDFATKNLVQKVSVRRTDSHHTPLLRVTLGLASSSSSRRTGVCAQGQSPVLTKPRVARPLTRVRAAQFPVLHMCVWRWHALGMNTSRHFNHQQWQWRWQWICFNWISLERKVGHGGKQSWV